MTIISPPPAPVPPVPPAAGQFHIAEREPLTWLVSILFTDAFWQRSTLTNGSYGLFALGATDAPLQPKYDSYPALYRAIDEWINNDEAAAGCLAKAKEAIEQDDLAYYVPEADEWGERPFYEPNTHVDAFKFLIWAEKNGIALNPDVVKAAKVVAWQAYNRNEAAQKQAHNYPAITQEEFARLKKAPLWRVDSAVMHAMGRRSRIDGKEVEFTGNGGLFKRMLTYVLDAEKSGQLRIIGYDKSFTLDEQRKPVDVFMLKAQVNPDEFIAWARTLPDELAMLAEPSQTTESVRPAYCTPDMALMYETVAKFWGDYDLANPNPNVAPVKADVVAWMLEEAKRRGIDMSKTRADAMDTIMRCPAARKGGNSL